MNAQINENKTCKIGLKQIDPCTNQKPIFEKQISIIKGEKKRKESTER